MVIKFSQVGAEKARMSVQSVEGELGRDAQSLRLSVTMRKQNVGPVQGRPQVHRWGEIYIPKTIRLYRYSALVLTFTFISLS